MIHGPMSGGTQNEGTIASLTLRQAGAPPRGQGSTVQRPWPRLKSLPRGTSLERTTPPSARAVAVMICSWRIVLQKNSTQAWMVAYRRTRFGCAVGTTCSARMTGS